MLEQARLENTVQSSFTAAQWTDMQEQSRLEQQAELMNRIRAQGGRRLPGIRRRLQNETVKSSFSYEQYQNMLEQARLENTVQSSFTAAQWANMQEQSRLEQQAELMDRIRAQGGRRLPGI